MIFANNLDPDETPQNVGPHLSSKVFWHLDYIAISRILDESSDFLLMFKEEKYKHFIEHAKS